MTVDEPRAEEINVTTTIVDLRCPAGPQKLLARQEQRGEPRVIDGDNLMVLPCRDCRRATEQAEGKRPVRVLHKFDILGALIETEIVWA